MSDAATEYSNVLDITDDLEVRQTIQRILDARRAKEQADRDVAEASAELVARFGDDYRALRIMEDGYLRDFNLVPESQQFYPDLEGLAYLEQHAPTLHAKVTKTVLDASAFNQAVEQGLFSRELLAAILPISEIDSDGVPVFKPAKTIRPQVRASKPKAVRTATPDATLEETA